uniref:Uncharacterized protein n=1 Tax=Arundo donax TaxID=35708 RepID=A0A0A9C929_ARUDO
MNIVTHECREIDRR